MDGVCCTGKSSALRDLEKNINIPVNFSDYMERINKIPMFREKHTNSSLQILYTCYNHLEIELYNHVISDRSPLSDLWYEYCFDIINKKKNN